MSPGLAGVAGGMWGGLAGALCGPCGASLVTRSLLNPPPPVPSLHPHPGNSQLQVHQKVVRGRLQLYRGVGPGAPQAAAPALLALAERWAAGGGPPAPGAVWEAAQVLRLAARWDEEDSSSSSSSSESEGEGSGGGRGAGAGRARRLRQRIRGGAGLVDAVLERLEAPFLRALQQHQERQQQVAEHGPGGSGQPGAAVSGGDPFLPTVPPQAWGALRTATALRHALRPGSASALRRGRQPSETAAAAAAAAATAWDEVLERNEMQLLQGHVALSLGRALAAHACEPPSGGGSGAGGRRGAARLSGMLMADWVTAGVRHPLLHAELMAPTVE